MLTNLNYFFSPLEWDAKSRRASPRLAKYWSQVNEYAPLKNLKKTRLKRLKNLIKHAYEKTELYSDYYNKYGVKPDLIQSEEDLRLLPVVNKNKFKNYKPNGAGTYVKGMPAWRSKAGVTSGSTGEPFCYFLDREYNSEKNALKNRFWGWAKADIYAPKIFCSPESARHFYPNLIFLNPHFIQSKKKEYIRTIRESGAKLLFGAPLTTFDLLWMLKKEGVKNISFEKAILGGHVVAAGLRSFFQKHFGCEIFEFYGCGEIGMMASECETHQGMHISEENLIVEIVDNKNMPVPPGTIGKILLTHLSNDVMPFIRYDIGDLGVVLPEECPCGRSLQRLLVEGRSNENLLLSPKGECISPGVVRDVLDSYFSYFHRYQMIQNNLAGFTLNIVPTQQYKKEMNSEIISKIRNNIGYPISINIQCVGSIQPLPSGKFQYFISDLWKKKFPEGILSVETLEKRLSAKKNSH